MSGVPSLLAGPAAAFAVFAGSAFLVCAILPTVNRQQAKRSRKIFFMAIFFMIVKLVIF
jgi:hypothetical protein